MAPPRCASSAARSSSSGSREIPAIDKLIDALVRLRWLDLPSDPTLERTFHTVGLIDGGTAPNAVSPAASAELLVRAVGPAEDILRVLAGLEPLVDVQEVLRVPVVRLHTGLGSILVAHTADGHLDLAEFMQAIDIYERLALTLIRQ